MKYQYQSQNTTAERNLQNDIQEIKRDKIQQNTSPLSKLQRLQTKRLEPQSFCNITNSVHNAIVKSTYFKDCQKLYLLADYLITRL